VHFEFEAELWRWQARQSALWTFVSVPAEASADILEVVDGMTGGFGSVRVDVRVGKTRWRTSIFPDSGGSFALPIKKAVRVAESLELGDVVSVQIELVDF
jgi:hypothetical protein